MIRYVTATDIREEAMVRNQALFGGPDRPGMVITNWEGTVAKPIHPAHLEDLQALAPGDVSRETDPRDEDVSRETEPDPEFDGEGDYPLWEG